MTVNDILSKIMDLYYLSAYDEDTPPEELRGNLWTVRDTLHEIMEEAGWMDDPHVLRDSEPEEWQVDHYEHR